MIRTTPFHGLVLAFLLISSVHAAPSAERLARQGADGVAACASCHGAQGEGNAAGFPALAGQPAGYLTKQLHDLANGARANPIMMPIAKALSDPQITALADYYAGLPATGGGGARDDQGAGRELAVNGAWGDNQPACIACHGEGARGVPPHFPALAGQHGGYIEGQLKAWKSGTRHGDAGGLMAAVAKRLDDAQIQAVSAWLAALPPSGEVPDAARPDPAPAAPDARPDRFQPPLRADLPNGKDGEAIRRGAAIFNQTHLHPQSAPFVGNGQDCSNCHMNGGRQADSAPMWAAWVLYPKYRGKNDKINSMAERIQGCFTYSQNAQASKNGAAPAADSALIADLQAYMHWQASGVPTGKTMKGQGYPELPKPAKAFSPTRGKALFAEHCALCHGDTGQGTAINGGTAKRDDDYAFPPLWGPNAYNWGAGMHRVNTAAGFIQTNMPLGNPGSLSNQDAWDLAAYINSRPRPQDPRFKGDLDATARDFHANQAMDYYGQSVDGYRLGSPGTLEKWIHAQ
ncbi:c-type cytochrome [Alloalcanivorax mobilis]|uniref:c-type cytochrome n=1 Tax=Alloalcanivorax mobilis TaxID=2019569 RepID=UPI000C794673|nr:c-type cytochrome [Alloalcanivorax mobilis]